MQRSHEGHILLNIGIVAQMNKLVEFLADIATRGIIEAALRQMIHT